MKNFFICFFLLTGFGTACYAQFRTVNMDYLQDDLNGNQPLPSEEFFIIKGAVNPDVRIVKLDILNSHHDRDTFYTDVWRRPIGNTTNTFNMPVHYKLRGNDQYDFVFTFYRMLDDSERIKFAKAVHHNLEAYIKSTSEVNSSRFTLRSPTKRMLEDMDQVVMNAFTYYRNGLLGPFPGFSDLVKNKLEQMNEVRLRNARYNVSSREDENKTEVRRRYALQLQQELLEMCMNEVMPYISNNLVVYQDQRQFKRYPTEKTPTVLALNVGYGGVYLSGDWGDLSYDAQPYVGVSFPLGNRRFSRFLGNTSISTGIFLHDFKDENDNNVTGPVIGKPFYLGLGYKVFQFVRINAGLVATSTEKGILQDVKFENVKLKPFVGLSAELNLWLGVGKK